MYKIIIFYSNIVHIFYLYSNYERRKHNYDFYDDEFILTISIEEINSRYIFFELQDSW